MIVTPQIAIKITTRIPFIIRTFMSNDLPQDINNKIVIAPINGIISLLKDRNGPPDIILMGLNDSNDR
jgi:hypothetical protein